MGATLMVTDSPATDMEAPRFAHHQCHAFGDPLAPDTAPLSPLLLTLGLFPRGSAATRLSGRMATQPPTASTPRTLSATVWATVSATAAAMTTMIWTWKAKLRTMVTDQRSGTVLSGTVRTAMEPTDALAVVVECITTTPASEM